MMFIVLNVGRGCLYSRIVCICSSFSSSVMWEYERMPWSIGFEWILVLSTPRFFCVWFLMLGLRQLLEWRRLRSCLCIKKCGSKNKLELSALVRGFLACARHCNVRVRKDAGQSILTGVLHLNFVMITRFCCCSWRRRFGPTSHEGAFHDVRVMNVWAASVPTTPLVLAAICSHCNVGVRKDGLNQF